MISLEEQITDYLRLANSNFDLSIDVSFEYAYKGLQLIIETGNTDLKVDYLNVLGRCHLERGNLTKSLNYFKKSLELAVQTNKNAKVFCECYNFIGKVHQRRNEYNKSLEYYQKSLEYYLPHINCVTANSMASIYRHQGQLELALKTAQDSYEMAKKYNKTQCSRTLSNLGNIYLAMGDKEKAIEKHKMSLFLVSTPDIHHREKHYVLMQLAQVFAKTGESKIAKNYCEQALELAKTHKNTIAVSESRAMLGYLFLKEEQYHSALTELLSAFEYANKHENDELKVTSLQQIIIAYQQLNNIELAFNYQSILTKILQAQLKRDNFQNLNQIIEEKEILIETLKTQYAKIGDQQTMLEQRNRELQELNFAFSHYLKEPLRQINSFVGLMQKEYKHKQDEKTTEYFAYIKEGSERIQSLLNDLMQYITIKDAVVVETINLNEIIDLVRDNFKNQILAKSVIFDLEELPEIKGNTYYICLLFQHLISNSIKFSREGEEPYITISYSKEVIDHLFCIEDNGIGIEKQYQDKIFSIFNRLDRESYLSTGIGLAICRKIVELHNGKIWIESEEGKGTKIYFTIRM